MKIVIQYRHGLEKANRVATTFINGRSYTGVGATWEAAKEDLLSYVKTAMSAPTPATEEVEIETEAK